jgi:hypothetical protein
MNQIKPSHIWPVAVNYFHAMAPLHQAFGGFADLHAIATTPVAGRSVVYQEDFHGHEHPTQ